MAPEIEEQEDEGGGDEWMTTFADLMSLLLTFFILLLSFANMDVIKFRDAQGSLKDAFGVQFDDTIKGEQRTKAASIVDLLYKTKDSVVNLELEIRQSQGAVKSMIQARMQSNEDIYKKLQSIVRDQNLGDQVVVENTSRGVIITVNGQLFFYSGSAVLREESFPLLDSITNVVADFPYKLTIEGHTDNTQIKTSEFPSNWELSTGRAISAVKYILSSGKIDPEKLGAGGYSDTRPIAQNDTPEGRRINRRIEFVFFRDDMEIKEFEDLRQKEDPETTTPDTPSIPDTSGSTEKSTEGATDKAPTTGTGTEEKPTGADGNKTEPLGQESINNEATTSPDAGAESSALKGAPSTDRPATTSPAKTKQATPSVRSLLPSSQAPLFKQSTDETNPSPKQAEATETKGTQSRATAKAKAKATKKNILQPINILGPIGITPESLERPTGSSAESTGTTPTKLDNNTGTQSFRPKKTSRPARRRAIKKTTAPAKTTPAKPAPYVPGKFSAPTD